MLEIRNIETPALTTTAEATSWSWTTWILIIIGLAVVGINVFAYLAQGTSMVAAVVAPLLKLVGYTAATVTKQTIDTGATGAKAGIGVVAATATDAIDLVQNTVDRLPPTALQKSLANTSQVQTTEVMPDEPRQMGKAGWCLIGESNQVRTCVEVGVNDTCMSGDIFPTQAVCVNPTLRA